MKRISILALILGACFASAWAQQDAGKPRSGKHPLLRHRIVNGMAKAPGAAAAANLKTWDLGHYPGGTWAQLGDINDFGVAVGIGDVLDGFTHTLSVPVFGPHAGKWTDLGTLGGTSSGGEDGEPVNRISNTGLIVGHSATAEGHVHAFAWTEKSGMVDLGTLVDIGYPDYNSSYAVGTNKLGTLIVGWSGVEVSCRASNCRSVRHGRDQKRFGDERV